MVFQRLVNPGSPKEESHGDAGKGGDPSTTNMIPLVMMFPITLDSVPQRRNIRRAFRQNTFP